MKLLLFLPIMLLFASMAFFPGCVNIYSDAIKEDCMNVNKYPSAHFQSECLLKKSHYYGAFGEADDAMAQCEMIKDLVSPSLLSSTSHWIGLNHEVNMYNDCVEDLAVNALDESYCKKKIYPSVFLSIQSILDKIPTPISSGSTESSYVSGCKEKVEFERQRQVRLPNIMTEFIKLMTNAPDFKRFGQ
jgi:hypothetical protein